MPAPLRGPACSSLNFLLLVGGGILTTRPRVWLKTGRAQIWARRAPPPALPRRDPAEGLAGARGGGAGPRRAPRLQGSPRGPRPVRVRGAWGVVLSCAAARLRSPRGGRRKVRTWLPACLPASPRRASAPSFPAPASPRRLPGGPSLPLSLRLHYRVKLRREGAETAAKRPPGRRAPLLPQSAPATPSPPPLLPIQYN